MRNVRYMMQTTDGVGSFLWRALPQRKSGRRLPSIAGLRFTCPSIVETIPVRGIPEDAIFE